MPAKDLFHEAVRNALVKDGWEITDDPLAIKIGELDAYIDLGAEKILAAQKDAQKIAVEIKSFLNRSPLTDFHNAIGQFINYRTALEDQEPERILYLAVPNDTYRKFFHEYLARLVVDRYEVKLIVYNAEEEVIVAWKN